MAYQKLQGKRAINVTPTDGVQIPSPSDEVASGDTSATVANQLVSATAEFIGKVLPGSTVINIDTGAWATVEKVQSNTELVLSANIFAGAPGESFKVYTVDVNEGPVLYVGTGGTLVITTVGNDLVTLVNVADATFIPIMVRTVEATNTTADDIIALW
tara:strand:+ start:1446 stop:1919 length:474 start_codon:yes stop_codon:yes gene_type:complete